MYSVPAAVEVGLEPEVVMGAEQPLELPRRLQQVQPAPHRRLRELHVAPLLGQALLLVAADNRHQRLLDRVLELVQRLLTENRELIRQRIATESPWWVPGAPRNTPPVPPDPSRHPFHRR